jgi:hypothetical protein
MSFVRIYAGNFLIVFILLSKQAFSFDVPRVTKHPFHFAIQTAEYIYIVANKAMLIKNKVVMWESCGNNLHVYTLVAAYN